jgi:ABC-2 type transport system ATP-binding protein
MGDDHGPAIRTRALTKRFGAITAVDQLDLDVERGEVFGFIGPNGAGKTTLIRLLLDLIRPTSGRIEVLGRDVREHALAIKARCGYLPGDLRLPPRSTGRELLTYFGRLRGAEAPVDLAALIDRLDVEVDRPIRELSRGNRQKIGLVQAFMHRPELLILDEPTSGLDPLVQQQFHGLVREATERGSTVFVSSHVLSEVQEIADRAAVLRSGSIVAIEPIADLRRRLVRRVEIRFDEPIHASEFAGLPGVRNAEVIDGALLRCEVEGDADALVKEAARHHVVAITGSAVDLEDLFLDLYRSVDHAA